MSSQKRKRSASAVSSGSSSATNLHRSQPLPSDTINPLSHSQSTLKQLSAAGLTETDVLPSTYLPNFPHRPIRPARRRSHGHAGEDDDLPPLPLSAEDDNARRARQMRGAQEQRLGVLTSVVLRALEEDDIPRARRAFGLLRRSEVRGKPVDLRRNGLWSLGAEVLMRAGETRSRTVLPGGQQQQQEKEEIVVMDNNDVGARNKTTLRRWGSPANMPQLRVYLEGLIRQYPYNRLHPDSISSLDFHPVLFSCELYNTWIEHKLALATLDRASETWSDDLDMPGGRYSDDNDDDDDDDSRLFGPTIRDRRLRQEKKTLAHRALAVMRDVAARMDALMENAPYNRSVEMLRLRGMVALYVGDLSVPPPPKTGDDEEEEEEEEGMRVRAEERARARVCFVRMRENGGRLDAFTERWLDGSGEDDHGANEEDDDLGSTWSSLPVFSSLPKR
ncbi:hypothetical protein M406DRAFT_40074 [Cryphonectria parasitica EP155]|uniref:Uncharacterized protein n=1 Tax=Cryphonectria parasitica (strain ATCC 38755 / EP155) TaxID=660469 RepID=A0A9P4Y867_CRYP1|nr:uncharacterized protein M406DRAFT_40074 [Cryphonectria parasitica EP155]KAF3767865.1 hypothetical protein M406DRAFT_40074 [Cryphonectria parasitica EP155]